MGYRWFDHEGIAPLFPFGAGLSYTSFRLTELKASSREAGVTAALTKAGIREGDTVVIGETEFRWDPAMMGNAGVDRDVVHYGETVVVTKENELADCEWDAEAYQRAEEEATSRAHSRMRRT